ncbi:alpha/beta hydrolase [Alteromonas sediminis]|uniref:Alpha/beta hydrolase n=1 Tax=Alteromonas sediminis TaxID=2259342 RepID=A0A3N5Y603_9ALTE|nr:alpha/beta hydrolase [Alteromonas sediminis]RPJ68713.1 alpha/beta hydrolase [Alteromonas sediminis]
MTTLNTTLSIKMGSWLYHTGNRAEAALYGLKKQTLNLDGIHHKVWTSSNKNKPALLLIHGFSATHAVWLRFARHLTDKFYVIIPELAGHGQTGFEKHWDYSVPAQSARMIDLIHGLNITQCHIAGNSMGGFIAAHMARTYPDACLSTVLIDPAGVISPQPSEMQIMLQRGENPFFVSNQADFDKFYSMTMAQPPFIPRLVLRALAVDYQQRKEALKVIFSKYNQAEHYIDKSETSIPCPTLLLWGAKDRLIDVSSVDVWQRFFNGHTHIWDSLGHMPMLEAPKDTAQTVMAFYRSQSLV